MRVIGIDSHSAWAQMMLLAAPLLAVAVALAASGSQMELHLLTNDIAQQHDAACLYAHGPRASRCCLHLTNRAARSS